VEHRLIGHIEPRVIVVITAIFRGVVSIPLRSVVTAAKPPPAVPAAVVMPLRKPTGRTVVAALASRRMLSIETAVSS
jgi:hypothetical protein